MPSQRDEENGNPNPISPIQLPGMLPIYQGAKGEKEFVGYAYTANSFPIEVPKSAALLAEEKRLGVEMKPVYKTLSFGRGETKQVGTPTHYEFDNGNNQITTYAPEGTYVNTVQKSSSNFSEDLLKFAGLVAGAYFLAPVVGSLFGSGAAAAAGGEAFAGTGAINEAIASGMAPGSFGASALPGALSAEQLAAAQGISAAGAATPLASIASLTTPNVGALGSANEAIASGMAPGSVGAASAAGGALTPAELAAASGTTTLGNIAVPAAISANEAVASGMSPGSAGAAAAAGAATAAGGGLTPAELAAAQGVSTAGSATANISPVTPNLPPTATPGTPPPPDVGPPGTNIPPVTPSFDPSLIQKLKDATGLTGTQLAALLSGGVNAASAANISGAIGEGLKGQREATKASQDVLKGIYDTQLGVQKPYQGAGVNAINQLGQLGSGTYQMYDPVTGKPTTTDTGSGYLTHQFNAADLAGGLAPNYDFMLQQGQMANQRAANVGGGALSGNTLQGLNRYTQDYAGTAYQNAFQNYQTQRNNIYKNLSDMAGIGQTANQGAGTAGTSYGTGITGLNTGLANATAAALLGQAQAASGGANAAANATFLAALLGQKTPT